MHSELHDREYHFNLGPEVLGLLLKLFSCNHELDTACWKLQMGAGEVFLTCVSLLFDNKSVAEALVLFRKLG